MPPLTLTGEDGGLGVQFLWKQVPGIPHRYHRQWREQVLLAAGQWMQVRFNARHKYNEGGAWYYEKHVLNIGLDEAVVPSLFVAGPPDYQITDFADLH